MSNVVFRQLRTNDISAPLTLEEIFNRYGSWAGIHDFNFDTIHELASKTVTGTAADDWTMSNWANGFPANFVLKYHKTVLRQGVMIAGPTSEFILIVGTDSNGYPTISYGNTTVVQSIPKETPVEADVEIAFRQQTFDDVNPVVWRSVSLYMNGEWITTFSDQVAAAYSNILVGFCAFDTDEVTYTNIEVPELCDIAEFGTLDPEEYAMGGLQRTIEGRYLKFFSRYDGAIRAWKKKQRTSDMTLTALEGTRRNYDLANLVTHARVIGAYIWEEAKDDALMVKYGHRFGGINNPMLLTQHECLEEAGKEINRSQEEAFTITTQARHVPLLEPEDRIEIDGEDWVINDFSFTASKSRLIQTYNCRKYVWE